VELILSTPITLYRVLPNGKLPPDSDPNYKLDVPPGTYQLRNISSPIGKINVPWIVTTCFGNCVGMALESLRSAAERSNGAISIR
jgi:hypothetical protein